VGRMIVRLARDESGAMAIEYGLIAALLGVGLIAASRALGFQISSPFTHSAPQ